MFLPTLTRRYTLTLVLLCMCLAAGCASTNRPSEHTAQTEPHSFPADFTLDVAVFIPSTSSNPDAPGRIDRYILEADSLLRASTTPDTAPQQHPPIVRRLSRDQIALLYQATQRLASLTTDESSQPHAGPRCRLTWTADRQRSTIHTLPTGPASPLIDRLRVYARQR